MVRLEHVNFSYGNLDVLKQVSFSLADSEFLGIIGPNGTGKTTILKMICGILKPGSGTVYVREEETGRYRKKDIARLVSMMPQQMAVNFPFTVSEFVLMGRMPYSRGLSFSNSKDMEKAVQAMEFTDVFSLRNRFFPELSGGEQKRVMLAHVLCQDTPLLLLDEPTEGMDLKYQVSMMERIHLQNKEKKKTVIMVTHDINLASLYCQKILLLHRGTVMAYDTPENVFVYPLLKNIYGTEIYIGRNEINGKLFVLPMAENNPQTLTNQHQ
jgi:iron complex transport system ATP-binding protein